MGKKQDGFGRVLYSTAIAAKICCDDDEEICEHMEGRNEITVEKADEIKGTAPRARSERSGTTSIPLIEKLLGDGLCDEADDDDDAGAGAKCDNLEISHGVYFRSTR